jgi:glyoxylase I family protein
MIECIDHVNLVVGDMQPMLAFYRDLLGLRLTKQATIEAPAGPRIELIRYRTPDRPRPSALGDPNTKGLRHIALRVTDLDVLVAALRRSGVELLSEVQQVPAAQVDYADQRKRLVYCLDPEGNLLELCAFES